MNCKFVSPALDYSGYGECSRHYIGAMLAAKINLTCRIPKYTKEQSDYDELGKLAVSLEDKELNYGVVIIHTTPDQFRKYKEDNKYNIGMCFWETDTIPPDFAQGCMHMDEIWTGSEFNKQAIINAGVDKPVYIIPEAIDANMDTTKIKPYKSIADKTFAFYSIFEWTERKNPDALLRAYWQEFTEKDDVSLVIKTYLDDFSVAKRREISQAIGSIKTQCNLDYYAPVYLYRDLMNRNQIYRFHKSFDCFISTHRGEGWGIPQMEAMLMGKPIISTNLGGIHEYLTDKKDALLLPYTMTGVTNSRNSSWYLPEQNWGQVDLADVRKAMRWVYDNKEKATKIGHNGNKIVNKEFSFEAVGSKIKKRLDEIVARDWK